MRVGLIILCTGKYDRFLRPLVNSAEEFFFPGGPYDIYLFSDAHVDPGIAKRGTIYHREVLHHPFPFIKMELYRFVSEYREMFRAENIFFIDADMKFVGTVGEEILPDDKGLVAVRHPGFWKSGWGDMKTDSRSKAYLSPSKWYGYVTGAFEGGKTELFVKAAEEMWDDICEDHKTSVEIGYDKNWGVLAHMHDESHWNRYVKTHPCKMLSPSYCYPETWTIPFEKKILALHKNMKEVR